MGWPRRSVRRLVHWNINTATFVASATGGVREATTNAMPCHSGGGATKKSARPAATRRADGGCGRSLCWSSSKMQRHRLPPPALISPPKPRLQTFQYLCSSVLSAHFHKYDDVCCGRDAPGFQAPRRGDAGTSAKRSHTEDRGVPSQPSWRRGIAGDLFVAPRRRCRCIASSSLLDLTSQAPSANVTVFMEGST